jgi:hypothetical protein
MELKMSNTPNIVVVPNVAWRIQTPGSSMSSATGSADTIELLTQTQYQDAANSNQVKFSDTNASKLVPITAVKAQFDALVTAIQAYTPSAPPTS